MIEIIYRDKRFLVKGSFSIGIAGNYVNEDFGDENIMINDTLEEIMKELQDEDSFWYKPLFPYLKSETADSGGIARGPTAYYNQKEKEIRENEKQINDCILYRLFSDLTGSGYPFWEIEQAVIPGRMKNGGGEFRGKEVYSKETAEVFQWADEFDCVPNNGTVDKTDVEERLRELFPMFNFEGLVKTMIPEGLSLQGRFMAFQFSDGWGSDLLECAYDEMDEEFAFRDWHNH